MARGRFLRRFLGRTLHKRPQSLLPILGLGVALPQGRELLGLQGTWGSLRWHRGVLLLHRRVLMLPHVITLPQKGLPPEHFYRDYRT